MVARSTPTQSPQLHGGLADMVRQSPGGNAQPVVPAQKRRRLPSATKTRTLTLTRTVIPLVACTLDRTLISVNCSEPRFEVRNLPALPRSGSTGSHGFCRAGLPRSGPPSVRGTS